MILVINGTNRQDNKTQVISNFVFEYLRQNAGEEVQYFSLQNLPSTIKIAEMYSSGTQDPTIKEIQKELLIPSKRWILVSPEYNGSYPGILKLFIDALSVNEISATFYHKKIGLIGVSDGRAGNIRGMDHLAAMFNYLKMTVYHNKLPISSVKSQLSEKELLKPTADTVKAYLDDYLAWL